MNSPIIEWAFAEQPLPGETESGDRCVVQVANDRATIAVIDGLGHGSEAALAAKAAVEILESYPNEGILPLFRLCHARLQATRGAAMTVARYDASAQQIEWLGAGNVRAILLSATPEGTAEYRDMLVYSGAVGVRLPTVEVLELHVHHGDVLVLATDGIQGAFADDLRHGEYPKSQAERLLASYRNQTDDALILVVRIVR
ncbi:MAG: SpoIIE family protein phosphatase [Steroidobacteraceae bacterium]